MKNCSTLILLCLTVIFPCCRHGRQTTGQSSGSKSGLVKYAERFSLEKKGTLFILTILNPWQGAVNINQVWYIASRNSVIPDDLDTTRLIRTPVHRIVVMSTTFISMISALGESDKVTGISGLSLLYDKNLYSKVKNGTIADVGYDENLNKELIIKIGPDILMTYGIGGESSGLAAKLKELGIKVVYNADYLENDPLGKAEWIKVFGVLFGKEKEANELFSDIENKYDSIKNAVTEKTKNRPSVLLGLPWKDTWFISPGNSYISRLISDAGGDYIWKNTKSESSMPYSLENVWVKAMKADYWLNISTVSGKDEILAVDSRLGDLQAFKNGNLYNNNMRVAENGGNDYWESGSVSPHIILKDIASILHPWLFPEYRYYYFKKVR